MRNNGGVIIWAQGLGSGSVLNGDLAIDAKSSHRDKPTFTNRQSRDLRRTCDRLGDHDTGAPDQIQFLLGLRLAQAMERYLA